MNFKNLLLIPLLTLSFSFTNCVESELSNFNKGDNYFQCLQNCRHHHQTTLALHRGEGRGMCFDICEKAHS